VFIFVNFSFALFTPPLGDYQDHAGAGGAGGGDRIENENRNENDRTRNGSLPLTALISSSDIRGSIRTTRGYIHVKKWAKTKLFFVIMYYLFSSILFVCLLYTYQPLLSKEGSRRCAETIMLTFDNRAHLKCFSGSKNGRASNCRQAGKLFKKIKVILGEA
jgi:hypothetical protein